jgi:hypothetical protein
MMHDAKMILLPVSLSVFELDIGKAVYRKSRLPAESTGYHDALLLAGFFFEIDFSKGWIYYSNSLAVFLGLPPTAEGLGWPKLDLAAFPGGGHESLLVDGCMAYNRNRVGSARFRKKKRADVKVMDSVNY